MAKYGLYTEEFGWVQEFQEFTENAGETKRVTFSSKAEAESARSNWGAAVKVKEIPSDND